MLLSPAAVSTAMHQAGACGRNVLNKAIKSKIKTLSMKSFNSEIVTPGTPEGLNNAYHQNLHCKSYYNDLRFRKDIVCHAPLCACTKQRSSPDGQGNPPNENWSGSSIGDKSGQGCIVTT